ncbi:MAG: DNA adenine methylase [Gemmatimonadetes bacterium]|nr:DNA adenine methylase [Gemmatimonadota bacterium]MCY3942493.1 DNA adenine methylase [Gemmatimonadota bacterium]
MIKYIGSKRVLVPTIVATIAGFPGVRSVLDLFSGTSRVGHALKQRGYHVHANDHLTYAAVLARCYVEADARKVADDAQALIDELAHATPREGYVTEVFCHQARYFRPANGRRIDGIRDRIERLDLCPTLRAIALTSLMEAADRVDSTTGVQMAYLKRWAPRAYNHLQLRVPHLLPGPGTASQHDALKAAMEVEADVAYLDPPYNQHSYMGNYHVWETLARWDHPEHYGVACKRIECQSYKSSFNRKREIGDAMRAILDALQARFVVVSFNNEGYLDRKELEAMLRERGHVRTVVVDHRRYVGARIGIHNPRGEKVGRISHLRNKEMLYLAGADEEAVDGAFERATAHGGNGQLGAAP